MEKRGKPRLSSGIWERALEHEDTLAKKLIDRAVEAIGAAVASALNLLDVEAVVIGGGLGLRLGEPYVERIRDAMMPHLFADHRRPTSCPPHSATSAARSAPRCWRPTRPPTHA